ncbi:radical SAM protein [Oceanirhabdus sp. W0125-5]|uniref:radical SAM protein n=1 Tax=Oceanirhabdus sp. W0125-5 TaxID=2999116 RepID=UPI0022F3078B|nr:radical SAM protein [Oceanirhabdus sp. W0125-5]WBW97319.1 radical SAM protein [Oceanirhabdus sp. W0125-5]
MNKKMILRMATDPKVIKSLWSYHKLMKRDKKYSLRKGIKMALEIMKGEKIVFHDGKYVICTFMPPFPSKAFDNHIKAVHDQDKIYTEQIYSRRRAPISFHIAVTHRCMYNCSYCSARGRGYGNELTTEQWKKVFKELQDMGTSVIGLTGGEPLLREDIEDLIGAFDERSSVVLFTTGKDLTLEKAKKLKDRGLFGVGISLDTVNPDKHNATRGFKEAYKYAIEGIKNSKEAGLYTIIQTVVLERDLDENKLYELFQLGKEMGVHEIKILEPIMSGELMNKPQEKGVFYSSEARKKLIEIGLRANKSGRFPKITTFAYTESKERYGCGAGTQHSYITAQGNLYPCDFVPMDFGNVSEESVEFLWKEMNQGIGIPKGRCFAMEINPRLKRLEDSLPLDKDKALSICRECQVREYPDFYSNMQK